MWTFRYMAALPRWFWHPGGSNWCRKIQTESVPPVETTGIFASPHRLARRPMSATLAAPSDAEVGMAQKTWEISGGGDALRELPPAPACLHEERDPGGRVRASGRYLTVRHGSGHVGVEDRLPSPARQPPDHGHESLPDHRGDEPGAHRDCQRAPTRRPPAPAAGLTRGEW